MAQTAISFAFIAITYTFTTTNALAKNNYQRVATSTLDETVRLVSHVLFILGIEQ